MDPTLIFILPFFAGPGTTKGLLIAADVCSKAHMLQEKLLKYTIWSLDLTLVSVRGVPSFPKHRKSLGQKVRLYRKVSGLTQEKLAEKADLSPVFISRVESGSENISVDALARIAKAVGVRLEDLLRGI